MRRKRTQPRLRVSRKSLQLQRVFFILFICIGVTCLLFRIWVVGSIFIPVGLLGLLFSGIVARNASHWYFTGGLEIENSTSLVRQNKGDRLRELQALRDNGIITEEEFEEKHAEVMREQW